MKLDFKNKTYTLRDGSEYRNYCDDAGGKYPIHGAFKNDEGVWIQIKHIFDGRFNLDFDGRFYSDDVKHAYDLIEVKKTHTITFWVNYYSNSEFGAWPSREEADVESSYGRIACLEITRTFTEGEGLEDRK